MAPARISPADDSALSNVLAGHVVNRTYSVRRDGIGLARHLWAFRVLLRAKTLAVRFHRDGAISDELIWAMFQVGYLDMAVRSGRSDAIDPSQLEQPDQVVIEELRTLLALARDSKLTVTRFLHLAPGLKAGWLTGGASPDLFVDGWLCDLKVVKPLSDATRWADQLVLYAALCSLGGVNYSWSDGQGPSDRWPQIHGIAVYFARHGEWTAVPLSQLITRSQLREVGYLLCRRYLRTTDVRKIGTLRHTLRYSGPGLR